MPSISSINPSLPEKRNERIKTILTIIDGGEILEAMVEQGLVWAMTMASSLETMEGDVIVAEKGLALVAAVYSVLVRTELGCQRLISKMVGAPPMESNDPAQGWLSHDPISKSGPGVCVNVQAFKDVFQTEENMSDSRTVAKEKAVHRVMEAL